MKMLETKVEIRVVWVSALGQVVQTHLSINAVVQAFLQSLYLELQETGAQATASSGFLSSCWTSLCLPLQSPLADVPLTTGEK